MADAFVAEIRIFPFNFSPRGWAFCDGQLLPISQNTALFSLIGTFYGGDGKSNFALPNMQGNVPVHTGANQPGPGLSNYVLGETGGSENVTLLESEIPSHSHAFRVGTQDFADVAVPSPSRILGKSTNAAAYVPASPAPTLTTMSPNALTPAGGDQPHNNMQPYLTLNFCIAMQGIFPARP
jgi:microcystin-dependent protein